MNRCIREYGLRDIGQLEQDLVFGDAGAKEVISILRSKQVCIERETKKQACC
jgi:syntaxin-binding protein 1